MPSPTTPPLPHSVEWIEANGGSLKLLDQTQLPEQTIWLHCTTVNQVDEAIRSLRVRGAPAIGIAAAYGVCVAAREAASLPPNQIQPHLRQAIQQLAQSRPTAVNLFWALDRMSRTLDQSEPHTSLPSLYDSLLAQARAIHEEDRAMCHAMGRFGAELLQDGSHIITHCNAGALATAELGTALAAIYTAHQQGKKLHVMVDETRPLLQGARLTAWELMQHGVPCTLICDSMAAQVMKEGRAQAAIVGADRITSRGDTANKIGTYGLAVLAKYHHVPFYVAAPSSTFDLNLERGDQIPIEQRNPTEITHGFGKLTAPQKVAVYNPAFDVTPAELITAIITERGIISPVSPENIARVLTTNLHP